MRQWDEATKAINARNDAIGQVSTELANVKAQVRAKNEDLTALSTDLDQKRNGNVSATVTIAGLERTIEKKRTQLAADKKSIHEYEDEVGAQRAEAQKAESELNTAKSAIASLTEARERNTRGLEEAQLTLEATKRQLAAEFEITDSVAGEAKQIDQLFKQRTDMDQATNKYDHRSLHPPAPHALPTCD